MGDLNTFLCFITAAGLSALGALPVGLINLSLANWTIKKGRRAGFVASAGAILVEFVYTFIAVYFIDILVSNAAIEMWIQIFSIVLFSLLSLYYYRSSLKQESIETEVKSGSKHSFWYGVGVTSINLLILPYWVFLTIWLKSNGYIIEDLREVIWIALGSALGAGAVFFIYVQLGNYIVRRIAHVNTYTNRALALLFGILAIVQLVRVIF